MSMRMSMHRTCQMLHANASLLSCQLSMYLARGKASQCCITVLQENIQYLADLLLRGRLRAVLARLRREAPACQEPAWQCRQLCTTALACCTLQLS